ncbi:SDR family NAD(P)-dependent oxidoreductase [Reyranella sp.]|uniref:SDR family NAD(P)-dependent oxidoreductase n=2 Tax=Reyranella sp. TaxID=1929291 RepID=UPI003D13FFE4
MAALQVAHALGGRVLATAGNDEKRAYLRACGVDYVGDSRSAAFAGEVLEVTAGQGVDVILNTLPADMNRHNIRLLRTGSGRLVDLRNMHYGAQLEYGALQRGILFSAFDLGAVAIADPEYVSGLLEELAPLFERGVLRPVPYRQTPPERLSETVRSFRKVAHVGKFVVSGAAGAVDLAPGMGGLKLRGDSTYLVSGGLTGFGLATARWLADGGARHLVLVGRRGAATAEAATALAELRAAGVEVEAVAADIADPAQVQELVIRLRRDHPPLRGIVHSAMVLSDAPLLDLTADQIRSVLAPKADGAWNLHRSTLDDPLDFFVCYSSMSALLGNRDQANYAAANEYVEALVRYRRAMGLPALVIGWGAIGATGYVARNQAIQDVFVRQGVYDLEPERAWTTIAHGLRTGASSLYAASVDWRTLRQFSRTVSASPCFSLVDGGQASHEGHAGNATAALADLAPNASPEERYRHLEQIMVREVCGVLGIDPLGLELDRPLQALGFDSLMAVELIVAVERATGHGLTRMSMLRPDVTTAELVAEVAGIVGTAPAAANGSRNAAAALPDAGDVRVEDLSDHEVDMLLRELETGEAGDE